MSRVISSYMVISFIILALIAWLVYFIVGKFVQGVPLQIVGVILALVVLIRGLALLGVSLP